MRLLDLVKQLPGNEKPFKTLSVMTYELGDVAKCLVRMDTYPSNTIGYRAEMRKALADLYIQLLVLCEWFGFDIEDLRVLGECALKERVSGERVG